MSTPNVTLLKQTLEHIKANPETWEQGLWCGTSQCFAGWAVTLAGMDINREQEVVHVDDMPANLAAEVDPDVEVITVREAAIVALGIGDSRLLDDGPEGDGDTLGADAVLFYAGNGMDDLERFVGRLCAEATGTAASS